MGGCSVLWGLHCIRYNKIQYDIRDNYQFQLITKTIFSGRGNGGRLGCNYGVRLGCNCGIHTVSIS